MRVRPLPLLALALTINLHAATGCSSDNEDSKASPSSTKPPERVPDDWNEECDPIVPWHCGFPFPSNRDLVDDTSTPTKKRVQFKGTTLPKYQGKQTNPAAWADLDGFSARGTLTK